MKDKYKESEKDRKARKGICDRKYEERLERTVCEVKLKEEKGIRDRRWK